MTWLTNRRASLEYASGLWTGLLVAILLYSSALHEYFGGITWDESVQRQGTTDQVSFAVATFSGISSEFNNAIVSDLEYYGIVSNIIPHTLSALFGFGPRGYFVVSHLFVLACALGCIYLAYWASGRLNLKNRWLAPLALAATPVFMGHGLFNTRDIPFAFFFTGFTCLLISLQTNRARGLPRVVGVLPLAVAAGATLSLKLVIAPVIFASMAFGVAYTWLVRSEDLIGARPRRSARIAHVIWAIVACMVVSTVTALALLPASWQEPLRFSVQAFFNFADNAWSGCMNFNGVCAGATDPDWSTLSYLIGWTSAKLTFVNMLWAILATWCGLRLVQGLLQRQQSPHQFVLLCLTLQLVALPLLAVLSNSNLYDGLRHLAFVFPALAVVGSFQAQSLLARMGSLHVFKFPLAALASLFVAASLSMTTIDMIALAPYQYTYINEARRSQLLNGETDLDYWAASIGELYRTRSGVSTLFATGAPFDSTRLSLGILLESAGDDTKNVIFFRPVGTLEPLASECAGISQVQRTYPLSRHVAILSVSADCPVTMPVRTIFADGLQ